MSRKFQWTSIFGVVCLVPCIALGADDESRESTAGNLPKLLARNASDRDPTSPSARMLERMGASMRHTIPPAETRPREETTAVTQIPDIRIKAIVFSDDDNGSAILTAGGRSVTVKLSRATTRSLTKGTSRSSSGFTIGAVTFTVEDFSENSIQLRLSSDNSVMVIQ
ncbi:MAG: hypothetical protein NTY15_07080 [Planctomycetota bacterium]|nr:hypothetical protein [Planctomycetota bacterium]